MGHVTTAHEAHDGSIHAGMFNSCAPCNGYQPCVGHPDCTGAFREEDKYADKTGWTFDVHEGDVPAHDHRTA